VAVGVKIPFWGHILEALTIEIRLSVEVDISLVKFLQRLSFIQHRREYFRIEGVLLVLLHLLFLLTDLRHVKVKVSLMMLVHLLCFERIAGLAGG